MESQQEQVIFETLGLWEHFTVRDGLPDMKIECIFEDSKGVIWIGTHDRGIVRYEGDEFKSYTRHDGLVSNHVFSIIEDDQCNLWFGTKQGLSCFDGDIFNTVFSEENCSFLWGSCKDYNGNLWFGMDRRLGKPGGVCRWDGMEAHVLDITKESRPIGQSIHHIVADDRGIIWFGGDGLYNYDGAVFRCVEKCTESIYQIQYLHVDQDHIWIASAEGIYNYDGINMVQVLESGQSSRGFSSVVKDGNGNYWFATYEGKLVFYDGENFIMVKWLDVVIRGGICIDRLGKLWIGTYGLGLYCYNAVLYQIFQIAQGLPSNSVYCLAGDIKATIWIGTKEGVTAFNGSHFFQLKELECIAGIETRTLLVDSRGWLWISTVDKFLYYFDGDELFLVLESPDVDTICLKEDLSGRIWFGAKFGGGVGYWENGQIQLFKSVDESVEPTCVGAIEVDKQGKVWIGSIGASIRSRLCQYYDNKFHIVDGIEHSPISDITEDKEGIMWVGTSEGLVCFDGDEIKRFTRKDGLSCEVITVLFCTDDGILWIGTEGGGVCCYDGEVFQIIEFFGDLALNVIHAVFQDSFDHLWFATEGGLIRFIPKRVPPKINITQILADEVYLGTDEIQFPDTVSRINIHFTGLSPIEQSLHLVYRYRLQGFDPEWRITRDLQVEYPKLKPGEYKFSIQCVDRFLNYSDMVEIDLSVNTDTQREHITALQEALRASDQPLIAESKAMKEVLNLTSSVTDVDINVLILAETGAGKGLLARKIHEMSPRKDKPFIPLNCGAIHSGLIESELFGHEKGAFTGAVARKIGHFELANGGTLFLDEIGDLPIKSQSSLLNILEANELTRVGGTQPVSIDVRIIAATNRDMDTARREGSFREDLYFRLCTFIIKLPPLRNRKKDIPLLLRYFVKQFARHLHRTIPEMDSDVIGYLQDYSWPGNVRELEHLVQRAVLVCNNDLIRLEDLPIKEIRTDSNGMTDRNGNTKSISKEEQEKQDIEEALKASNGIIYGDRGAAKALGMHPERLRSRMRKFNIKKPDRRI